MNILECKNNLLDRVKSILSENEKYASQISLEIQSFKSKNEYLDMIDFYSDFFKSGSRNYFTITSKENFNEFEKIEEGHTFIYTPLNDHSRHYMHKGDVVFCYRQGQFDNLGEALNVRGVYAVGFILSEPRELYPEKVKHNRWGVAITLPVIIPNHLELRNIQLHPKTINLTPYNGNRNDALQYIEASSHYRTLLSLVISRNPSIGSDLCSILGFTPDKEELPDIFWKSDKSDVKNKRFLMNDRVLPLQQIYYGAPGTGKSYTINEQTEGESVIRTTFHPDSDYSTFVGAYKPTMGLLPICDELGTPLQIMGKVPYKEQIIYEFVEQAFLQAYVNAWKNLVFNGGKKQYLVIEEINRGNCAQVFGDLFQLLDRNVYGFSDYPIHADKDMQKFLKKAFARTDDPSKQIFLQEDEKLRINNMYRSKDDVVSKVLSGEILLLPNNLYIWATMNTSDQSLFPIDSAFKRRWEWQYMPIGKGYDEKGQEIKWAIEGATKKYDWWSFLNKINAEVGEATQSEDKKLGFFFCKATDGVITAEKFVGKVIFYLWNDVFKNNGFEGPIFRDVDGTELSFSKFYKSDMKGNAIVQKDKVELFLNNLGVEEAGFVEVEEEVIEMDEDGNETSTSSNSSYDRSKYSINGVGNYGKGNVAYEAVKLYVANNPTKTADEIVKEWLALGMKITGFVETQAAFNDRKNASKDPNLERRRKIVTLSNGELIYVSNQYGPDRIADLMSKVNATNWGISISKV